MADIKFLSELFIPHLNEEVNIPKYIHLYRVIERCIINNQLVAHSKLPSTRALADSLMVSRNTVKSAFELLQAEGYIDTRQGAGTFVCGNKSIASAAELVIKNTSANPVKPAIKFSRLMAQLNWQEYTTSSFFDGVLAPSTPAVAEFPWMQWQKAINYAGRVMKHETSASTLGHDALREQIASYLKIVRGVKCKKDNILIFSGSQQGIYMTLQLLINPNEAVLVESPTYFGIDGAINAIGAKKIVVNVDEQGFHLQESDAGKSKLAVLTPSRNYPLGYSLSLKRRLSLIEWANQNDSWILEDDYDSEFRFSAPPLTALQGLSDTGRVIYSGTFSKILHPSIRIGYLVLPDELVEPFSVAKKLMHGNISILPQLALARFMASGHFSAHVRRMRKLYSVRKASLTSLMTQYIAKHLTLIETDGGMHCVYLLNQTISDTQVCTLGREVGLAMQPLSAYYSSTDDAKNGLVIGFAGYCQDSQEKAVKQLSQIIKNIL